MMNFRNHINLPSSLLIELTTWSIILNLIERNEITIIKNPKNNKIYLKINVLFIFIKKYKKTY